MPRVHFQQPLLKLTDGAEVVEAAGATVGAVLDALEARHAGVKAEILDERGEIRRFINIYLNDEDVRFLEGLATAVCDDDTVAIIPAIAGG